MSAFSEVLTRLDGVGYPVRDSDATDPDGVPFKAPYVVVSGGVRDRVDDGRLAKGQDVDSDHEVTFTVMSVAATADGARSLDERAFALLVGWVPSVPGRRVSAVQCTATTDPEWDVTVRPALWYVERDYRVMSRR